MTWHSEHQRLKRVAIGGAVINVLLQIVRFALRLGYQVVISRLLLPGDFGLVAMVAPAVTFVQLFVDLGLSQATIQRKVINQAQLSFLFWLNVVAGVLLAGACVIFAPLVARFYGDPRVSGVMIAAGILLLVSSFYSQHMALLNRQMRFGALAGLDLMSFVIGAAGGIAAAMLGAGYWSIIVNQAVVTLTAMLIAWAMTRWIPGRPGRFADMKPLLHFGGNITAFNVTNFISRNSDNILIGRFDGEYSLGLYDRAFKLMLLPFEQISVPFSKVAVPLLSRSQDQPDFYRRAYRRMLEVELLLLYPGLVFMISTSRELIVTVLGTQWAEVAPIFAILGIDAFVAPLAHSMGWLFVSQGRTREMRDWSVLTAIVFVTCFVVGLHWGPQGVAGGYAVAGLVEISFLWRVATRKGPLPGSDFLLLIIPFLIGVAITFAAVLSLRQILPTRPVSLVLEAFCAYAIFAAALAIQPRGRRTLHELVQQAASLLVRSTKAKNNAVN